VGGRFSKALRRLLGVGVLFAFLGLAGPAGAVPNWVATAPVRIAWQAPTPKPGARFTVEAGSSVSFSVAALAPSSIPVRIVASGLPRGAQLSAADGIPATAGITWTPATNQIQDYTVTFTAKTLAGPLLRARPLRVHLRVYGKWVLSGENETYHWAYVNVPAVARRAPSRGAPAIRRLGLWTPENTPNLVLALNGERKRNGQTWVRVRLAMLPNNTTGWVLRGALGHFRRIRTHLIVSRAGTVATLYKAGKVAWRARVGVGQPQWPTPRGEFFIRERLSGFNNPTYGPVAFGTSARSQVLTDWPGGGFVGIHGTNAPGLIPGHISHGCIRVRNASILRLWRLMPLGTPLTVT
jgi:hypothetical protein